MDFIRRNIIFISVVLGTLILIGGGVFLFSKGSSISPNSSKVSDNILVPSDAQITGGIKNGAYQPKSSTAKVTLVEFGDYECPACGAYSPLVRQLLTELTGQINYVFRNYPLSQHANAAVSSYAAEAAGLQGKFWEMHDKLYDNQNDWVNLSDPKPIFDGYAKGMSLNIPQFDSDINSQKVKDKISRDLGDGNLISLNATPTFYVNGIKIETLPASYDEFKNLINDAIKNQPLPTGSGAPAYHIHFDLKAYINGSPVNFSLAKYQESKTNPLDENIHFHDGNGDIVHVHKVNVALTELFSSLKIAFPADNSKNNLKVYVNGTLNQQVLNYIPQDTDQVLVSYGPVTDPKITSQLSSVTKNSCIYSLKCPEKGTPPPEDCVGGLGTGCTD